MLEKLCAWLRISFPLLPALLGEGENNNMKIEEIRILSDAELLKQLSDAREELFNLRFRMATHQLANHREIPEVRRGKIARMETVIRERELGIR